jgi:large subunit ribosomal protein L3
MSSAKMGLLGTKLGMTQIFDDAGNTIGVTILEVKPNRVIQVKTSKTKDGYPSVQLGYGLKKASRISKAVQGHLAKTGANAPLVRYIKEFRVSDEIANKYQVGQEIKPSEIFAVKERIDIAGVTKGRGFTGVMKRHNFSGFKRTHGAHEYKRHGGSIGTRLTPGMTLKGMPMGGQYGTENVTIQNLQIVRIDADRNLVFLKGGVPGPNGALVKIKKAAKG